MLISTTNDLPGFEITEVLREMGDPWTDICAYGTAVRTRPTAASALAPPPAD